MGIQLGIMNKIKTIGIYYNLLREINNDSVILKYHHKETSYKIMKNNNNNNNNYTVIMNKHSYDLPLHVIKHDCYERFLTYENAENNFTNIDI